MQLSNSSVMDGNIIEIYDKMRRLCPKITIRYTSGARGSYNFVRLIDLTIAL